MKYVTMRSDSRYTTIRKVEPQKEAPSPTVLRAKIGDDVSYSAYFLKVICVGPTDPRWRRRGKVVAVNGDLASVLWEDDSEVHLVNAANIRLYGQG